MDDLRLINRPNIPVHPLAKPATYHNPYTPLSIREAIPAVPIPYETWTGSDWMLERDGSRSAVEATSMNIDFSELDSLSEAEFCKLEIAVDKLLAVFSDYRNRRLPTTTTGTVISASGRNEE